MEVNMFVNHRLGRLWTLSDFIKDSNSCVAFRKCRFANETNFRNHHIPYGVDWTEFGISIDISISIEDCPLAEV